MNSSHIHRLSSSEEFRRKFLDDLEFNNTFQKKEFEITLDENIGKVFLILVKQIAPPHLMLKFYRLILP